MAKHGFESDFFFEHRRASHLAKIADGRANNEGSPILIESWRDGLCDIILIVNTMSMLKFPPMFVYLFVHRYYFRPSKNIEKFFSSH